MMNKAEVMSMYKDIEKYYDENVNTTEMPEGDFNVLEAEYDMLRAILEIE